MRQRTKSVQFLLSKAFSSWTAPMAAAPGGLGYHNCEIFSISFLFKESSNPMKTTGHVPESQNAKLDLILEAVAVLLLQPD